MSAPPAGEDAYRGAVARVGQAALAALQGMEVAERRLHPPLVAQLRQALGPARDRLEEALEAFAEAAPADAVLRRFHEQLAAGAGEALAALRLFLDRAAPHEATARILASLGHARRAQSSLYGLRGVLPGLEPLFLEAGAPAAARDADPTPPEGFRAGLFEAPPERGERGGFSLYVPEWWDGAAPRPLVVALHGGSGSGRDFLWTWLREARSRGFVLLAPTSIGPTWSLDAPGVDAARLVSMLEFVAARWPIDRARVLLTGLSDGATFTLLAGLLEDAPYTALAPVSGVLHPASFALGNLGRARGRRIHQTHGALDWLFPVALARLARDELQRAGADLVYCEIEDLSHTYPREHNAEILAWFDPSLALAI
ncbi:MAG: phospholipase [Proteobacteria bacterium]|nr:MAG: phospholipase [Pseudomonadota bacterium]